MKWTLGKVSVTAEEVDRIEKEERRSRTILSSIRQCSGNIRKGQKHIYGKLLTSIGKRQVIEATVLLDHHRSPLPTSIFQRFTGHKTESMSVC